MRIGNCAYEHTTIEASTRYDVHVTRSGILPTRHVTPATSHAKSAAIHVAANDEMPCRLDSICITAITMLRFSAHNSSRDAEEAAFLVTNSELKYEHGAMYVEGPRLKTPACA